MFKLIIKNLIIYKTHWKSVRNIINDKNNKRRIRKLKMTGKSVMKS